MFSYIQSRTLIRILKEHKEYTKDLSACFRDDEEVDEIIEIIKNNEVDHVRK